MEATYYDIQQLAELPTTPGVYQFYNAKDILLYVGKAKNLKKRIASYFNKKRGHLLKTRKMIAQVTHLRFILVHTEYEALLLENNLIKKFQPRYNVLLKDSKSYPYLCLTKGPFPRLITTRQRTPALGQYFGPFTSTRHLEQIKELIKELYTLRTCTYQLTQANIQKKKFKVCLEYHIGNCLGPCAGLQEEKAYEADIEQVVHLLKGNFQAIKKVLKPKMLAAAKARKFVAAQAYKEKLEAIAKYQAKSIIVHPTLGNLDVLTLVEEENQLFVNYLHLSKGLITFAQTIEIQKKIEEKTEEIMGLALCHFRTKVDSTATTILSNTTIAPLPASTEVIIPKLGDKRKIVDISLKNAYFYKKETLHTRKSSTRGSRSTLLLLQQDLHLKEVPMHIECFDNSNIQGTHPVAAMVAFKKGKPAKKSYRHYHIQTVEGPDDFASMAEIIERRYKRLLAEKSPLPNLIIIDGGKGQLSSATQSLKKIGLYGKIAIISIAKKLEAIYYPEDPHPLYIQKTSPSLKLIQKIRDEAHRFAITFHKKKRIQHNLQSVLEEIPSVGPKTIQKLLQTFGSTEVIKQTSVEKLSACVGSAKATAIEKYFKLKS